MVVKPAGGQSQWKDDGDEARTEVRDEAMATAVMMVATWRRGCGGGGASSCHVGHAATTKWRVTLNRRSLVMMLAHKSLRATGRGRALEVRAS